MSRQHIIKWQKQNNSGSAIVAVLVVVAFITILATIMLYVSGSNFQMKVADYRTKESFYYAETPVEELRAQLIEDVQVAFAKAYTQAMSEYSGLGTAENAEDNYTRLFCDEMNNIWKERCGIDADGKLQWKSGIECVAQQPPTSIGGGWQLTGIPTGNTFDDSRVAEKGWLILRGVEFTYDSNEGYTSIISTDFCITIPVVQWPDADGNYSPKDPDASDKLNFSNCVDYMNWTKK